ncbi:hypothetical protein RRG08_020546 [Elysia crispata]|uniref:Uncharacterized protein n=1 Tax=Elysia crispata TaxID=231223 RepID=A0AAE1A5S5_9GAST|nr:hypothetical protein RRG08_020546 [Elysia crispata]
MVRYGKTRGVCTIPGVPLTRSAQVARRSGAGVWGSARLVFKVDSWYPPLWPSGIVHAQWSVAPASRGSFIV